VSHGGRLAETLTLPVSKTDPQAKGCRRIWGCVCDGLLDRPCPYHSALNLRSTLVAKFGDERGRLPANLPLFPNATGGWCKRAGFIDTMKYFAARLSLDQVDGLGRELLGEHVWRVSGAQHLASLDIPIPIIMLLARWGSSVVMRYIAEAPLSNLTSIYVDRIKSMPVSALRGAFGATQPTPAGGVGEVSELDPQRLMDDADVEPDDPAFILNLKNTSYHLAGKVGMFESPLEWKTPCGFSYGLTKFKRLSTLPLEADLCDRCLKWQSRQRASS